MSNPEKSLQLSVLLVEDQPEMGLDLQENLLALGHQVPAVCVSGKQACQLRLALTPDLVLMKSRLPDMDGLAAAHLMQQTGAVPVVLMAAPADGGPPQEAKQSGVFGYLPQPVDPVILGPALLLAWQGFQLVRRLEGDVDGLEKSLAERKAIERAKGILMEQMGLGQKEALARLEQEAQRQGLSLGRMAEGVLTNQGIRDLARKN